MVLNSTVILNRFDKVFGLVASIVFIPAIAVQTNAVAVPLQLTEPQVTEELQQLPGWATDGQRLSCTYQFTNFIESVAFVNRLVEPAEALAHHPDLTISYNRVGISLTTHDAGGLTEVDFALAAAIAAASGDTNSSATVPRSCEP